MRVMPTIIFGLFQIIIGLLFVTLNRCRLNYTKTVFDALYPLQRFNYCLQAFAHSFCLKQNRRLLQFLLDYTSFD